MPTGTATRQTFAEAERIFIAKVPGRPNKVCFPKEDFKIDLQAGTCTCPAGQVTQVRGRLQSHPDGQSGWQRPWGFVFDANVCSVCELRQQCIASKKGKGRTVSLHPQEALLQQARIFQKSEAFTEYRKRRQVAEHRLARLVQLGIRQSCYFGRTKTLFQLLLAATVANLTLVATKIGAMAKSPRLTPPFMAFLHLFVSVTAIIISAFQYMVMQPLKWSALNRFS